MNKLTGIIETMARSKRIAIFIKPPCLKGVRNSRALLRSSRLGV